MCDNFLDESLVNISIAWPGDFEEAPTPDEECILWPFVSLICMSFKPNGIRSPTEALFEQADTFTSDLLMIDSDVQECCPTEVADMMSFRDMPL